MKEKKGEVKTKNGKKGKGKVVLEKKREGIKE